MSTDDRSDEVDLVGLPDLVAKLDIGALGGIAVAESLTGGLLSSRLARLPEAATWFRGGIVAYCRPVKERLLGIGDAAVVSREAAIAMARQVTTLLGSAVGLAVTGVGGPEPEDGIDAGTVWIAASTSRPWAEGDGRAGHRDTDDVQALAELHRFGGDPGDVLDQTCDAALRLLTSVLRSTARPK